MSSSFDFLRFPPLGLLDKARLAWTILYASRVSDPAPLEQISVVDWLTRLSGKRTVDRIWLPLLRSKLGENYRVASAAFIWAIIARLYAARRAGLKREQFGYVEGGYDAVLTRLRAVLEERGVEILCGQPVSSVSGDSAGATVELADGTRRRFDAAVLTVACPRVAAMCPQLSATERDRLRSVVYQGVICPSLLLAPAARRLLRHQHHRPRHPVYGRDRDDGARRSVDVWRSLAGVSAPLLGAERPDVEAH